MVPEPSTAHSALTTTSLVPRQVVLAMSASSAAGKEDRKAKKEKEKKKKSKKGLVLMDEGKIALLRSIAAFLETNGFPRTLAVFRSEAHIERDDVEGKSVNLEDILCRFLELRTSYSEKDYKDKNASEKGNKSGISEDVKTDLGVSNSHGDRALTGVEQKKRKSRSISDTGEHSLEVTEENMADTCMGNQPKEAREGTKAKKKKKIESSSSLDGKGEQIDSENLHEFVEEKLEDLKSVIQSNTCQLDESGQKPKTKRKKKQKPVLSTANANLVGSEAAKEVVNADGGSQVLEHDKKNIPAEDAVIDVESEPNDKKKKKKSTTEIADQLDGGLVLEAKKESSHEKQMDEVMSMEETIEVPTKKNNLAGNLTINIMSKTMDKRKNKKKLTTGTADHLDGEAMKEGSAPVNQMEKVTSMEKVIDGAKSKKPKRKKSAVEGESQLDGSPTVQALEQNEKDSDKNKEKQLQKLDASIPCEGENSCMNKKQKTQGIQEVTKLDENTIDDKKVQDHQESNGTHAKNGSNTPALVNAKEIVKQSDEPKMVKAFQRVKLGEVKFADERLKDNSYWAKSGAESGYGAKAQDVLGQVKGRGFRHEKTKKKRGSYRGGQIDLGSHSIKFSYSDEE